MGNAFFQIELHRELARLLRNQGRAGDARTHFGQVLRLGEQAAATIDDPAMRDAYLAAQPFAESKSAI